MKVRALIKFNDLKEKTVREIGDEFIVSKTRFEEITKAGNFVEVVEEVTEETEEDIKKQEKKNIKK